MGVYFKSLFKLKINNNSPYACMKDVTGKIETIGLYWIDVFILFVFYLKKTYVADENEV